MNTDVVYRFQHKIEAIKLNIFYCSSWLAIETFKFKKVNIRKVRINKYNVNPYNVLVHFINKQ